MLKTRQKLGLGFAVIALINCSQTEFSGSGKVTPVPENADTTQGTDGSVNSDGQTGSEKNSSNDAGSNGSTSSPTPSPSPIAGSKDEAASFKFKLLDPMLTNVPLDVTIFLDNSGSMFNEAGIVRDNIARFITSVGSRADLKLILVSLETKMAEINGKQENAGAKLPQDMIDRGHVQLNLEPGDRSMLAAAAAAACPSATTSRAYLDSAGRSVSLFANVDSCVTKICGQDVVVPKCNRTDFINGPVIPKVNDGFPWPVIWMQTDPIDKLAGKVNSELRLDSKRVFIFISDDDSTVVDETNFLGLVRPFSGRRAPRVFAFTGVPNVTMGKPEDGCYLANYGRSYVKLSQTTGGSVFDICKLDWTSSFDSLATALTEEVATETLYAIDSAKPVKRILSVTYGNNVPVPANKYGLVTGNYLKLDLEVVRALAGQDITVKFER